MDEYELRRLDLREQYAAGTIAEMVGNADPVLVAGCSWGRDVFELRDRGHTVIAADIVPQKHLPDALCLDLTKGLPFKPKSLGVVILAEVLEHLLDDLAALKLAREALSDDGLLIVSVPYYNDKPEHHPRIHSPRTLRRLLGAAGFTILEERTRGGMIRFAGLAGLARGAGYRLTRMSRRGRSETSAETWKKVAARVNEPIIKYDSRRAKSPPFWFRTGRYYGAFFKARKGQASYDPVAAQKKSYGDDPGDD